MNFILFEHRLEISLRHGAYTPDSGEVLTAEETLTRLVASPGMEKREIKETEVKQLQSLSDKIVNAEEGDIEGAENLDALRVLQKLDDAKCSDIDEEFTRIVQELRALIFSTSDEKKRLVVNILSDLK